MSLHLAVESCAEHAARREFLWEGRFSDDDFLQVRVGSGAVALCCPVRVDVGSNPLADHDPDLLALAHGVVAQYAHLSADPVAASLRAVGTFAISGLPSATR